MNTNHTLYLSNNQRIEVTTKDGVQHIVRLTLTDVHRMPSSEKVVSALADWFLSMVGKGYMDDILTEAYGPKRQADFWDACLRLRAKS